MKEEVYAPLEINLENAEAIWNRIIQIEGEVFTKKRNVPFRYFVSAQKIQIVGNKPFPLNKRNFENAIPSFDPVGPRTFPKDKIMGTSYVWGIFNRINNGN
jgi:hypothetical protein